MIAKRQLIPAFVLTILVGAGLMAGSLAAQTSPQAAFDYYSNAVVAEVRDDRGQEVLKGQFTRPSNPEEERKAPLAQTGIDADATGEAEIEISGSGNSRRQEVEFELRNLQPGGVFSFFIDGRLFATVTANNRGGAEHERDVPLP